MEWSALYTSENQPSLEMSAEYINNPLWMEFHSRIQSKYQIEPRMEYSRCSMQAGWNMKYKKSGKTLCTHYPMRGYYSPCRDRQERVDRGGAFDAVML